MAASFGIYFGCTSACLAVCKDGKADVIANDTGDRTTPAIVSYTDHDQTVGLPAKQGIIRNALNTISNVKKYLGKSCDDPEVKELMEKSSVKVINEDGQPVFEVMYKEKVTKLTPVEVATAIYKKMMDTAQSHGGIADSHDAVITVPLHFTQEQKDATSEAATKAGFHILRIMSEPAATVLAYDIGQTSRDCSQSINILVYRLGGTSLDTTVLTVSNGMYRVISHDHNKELGGYLIDDLIINYFASEFKKQWKADCRENSRSVMKLRNASENCKRILSRMQTAQCSVESLYEGIDFQSTISRGRLEALCTSFLQKCSGSLQTVLDKARMNKDDIHKVIVSGGCAMLPSIQQQLKEFFPQAELLSSIPPDQVIAIGASKQAAILSGLDDVLIQKNSEEMNLQCLPVDLLLKLSDNGGYLPVMQKYTPVPAKTQKSVQLSQEQDSICMKICSRCSLSEEPLCLAQIVLRELPKGARVDALYNVKGDGSLIVTCSEPKTNKSEYVVIECS